MRERVSKCFCSGLRPGVCGRQLVNCGKATERENEEKREREESKEREASSFRLLSWQSDREREPCG